MLAGLRPTDASRASFRRGPAPVRRPLPPPEEKHQPHAGANLKTPPGLVFFLAKPCLTHSSGFGNEGGRVNPWGVGLWRLRDHQAGLEGAGLGDEVALPVGPRAPRPRPPPRQPVRRSSWGQRVKSKLSSADLMLRASLSPT